MKIIQFPITVTIADTKNGTIHWEDTAFNKQDILNYHKEFLELCQEEETEDNPKFGFEIGDQFPPRIAVSAYEKLVLPSENQ